MSDFGLVTTLAALALSFACATGSVSSIVVAL